MSVKVLMPAISPPAASLAPEQADSDFLVIRRPRLRLVIPLIVAFAFFMEQLDSTIVTTAIPDMARSLGVPPLQLNLAITSYILSLAVFIPISGWIADRFGVRRVFAAALLIFTFASALCGAASSLPVLVVTRVLQGFGGAMMTPVGRLVLLRSFPRSQLVTAMTYMTLPAIIGPTIGPVLGGLLTTYATWRWIFYVNIPIGMLGILLALRFFEDSAVARPAPFDIRGFLLCGSGLALLQFGLENVGRPVLPAFWVAIIALGGLVLLAAYVWHAKRMTDPALDLSLFGIRTFRISTLSGGVSRIGVNAVPFMLTLMLQIGFGLSPVVSGSLTFAMSLGAGLLRLVSSRALRMFGFRRLLIGNGLFCAAVTAGFALTQPTTPHWLIFLHVVVFGLARSTQFVSTNTLTYVDAPANKLSRSTSLGGVVQQLTISLGVSIAAALLGAIARPGRLPSVADFHVAFLCVAAITLISIPGFFGLSTTDGAHVSRHRIKG
jgi:EmrB/QacA subfamily drug resistance transporter